MSASRMPLPPPFPSYMDGSCHSSAAQMLAHNVTLMNAIITVQSARNNSSNNTKFDDEKREFNALLGEGRSLQRAYRIYFGGDFSLSDRGVEEGDGP